MPTAKPPDKSSPGVVIQTRYDAIGGFPNPRTVCKGPCEGMGVYPDMPKGPLHLSRKKVKDVKFKKCPRCKGTGREP